MTFSKKLANLEAAVALYFAYYHFVRMHKSLRMTTAKASSGLSESVKAFFALPPLINTARTAFWTLCVCAYSLGIWCTLALCFDLRLLHFEFDLYAGAFGNWPKEAYFTSFMYEITSLAMIPFVIFLRRSRSIAVLGLGVWLFEVYWFLEPAFQLFSSQAHSSN
jgi:hypothetical protein